MESLNGLDLVIITVLIISAVLAYMRGFIHEVLSIAGWGGAAISVLYLLPAVRPFVQDHIESKMVADGIASVTIFVVVLITLTFITHYISDKIRESKLNLLDRTAGFAFGLARGVLFLSLAYVFASMFINEKNKPEILENSKSLFVVEFAVDSMKEIVPDDFMPTEMYNLDALKDSNSLSTDDSNKDKEEDLDNDSPKDSDKKDDSKPSDIETKNENNKTETSTENRIINTEKLQQIIVELQAKIKFLEENGSIADYEKLIDLKQKYNDAILAKESAQKEDSSKVELDKKLDEIYNLLTQPKVDSIDSKQKNDAKQDDKKEKGYSEKERIELERLIDNNQ